MLLILREIEALSEPCYNQVWRGFIMFENMPDQRLLEKLEKSINLYNDHIEEVIEDIGKSQFPHSLKALVSGLEKIEQLRMVVFSEEINFYSAQALERIILEHHIIHVYIAFQAFFTESDAMGEKYYKEYAHAEKLIRFVNKYKMQNPDLPIGTPRYDIYKKINPHDHISREQFKGYMDIFDHQFSLSKTVIPELLGFRGKNDLIDTYLGNFPPMLRIYSELCSYVHGGPIAEMEFKMFKEKEKIKRIDTSRIWSIHATRWAIQYIFILLFRSGYDKYFGLFQRII